MDFMLCKWPQGLSGSTDSLAMYMDGLNAELPNTEGYTAVISFSHFLPRTELMPEKRFRS
eukprot:3861738-Amphidinium_carterae.1